jgi:hypothetical protein
VTTELAHPKPKRSGHDLGRLLQRARAGEEASVAGLQNLLDRSPAIVQILGGDLAREAERALVQAISGDDVAQREAIRRKMADLRLELGGPSPPPLERLLVERVVLCWLHVYYADCGFAQAGEVTFEHHEFLQRQQDRAQRRYLAAVKCLATLRRLLLPIKLDVTVAATVPTSNNESRCRRPIAASPALHVQHQRL